MSKRKKSSPGDSLNWLVFPLLAINTYAGWQIWCAAEHWAVKLFSSFSDSLTQLAIILIVNSLVILILALIKS